MNDISEGIDMFAVSAAQIELFRLSQGRVPELIDWERIKIFRGILAKMCEEPNNQEVQICLTEVFNEFHKKHPCRRRMDDPTPKGILNELDWLINGRSPIRCRAERLYGFCYFFSERISTKESAILSIPRTVAV